MKEIEMDVIAHDFAATAPPTVHDDERRHFRAGSVWMGTDWDHFFLCLDATHGAAVWERLPLPETMRHEGPPEHASVN